MPNKTTTDNNYRYNFQGQEKDPETGMEAFELRLWDGRLGRWLTVDPYGQYASPYLGMGNNPMNMIDPDGGFATGGNPPKNPHTKFLDKWLGIANALQLPESEYFNSVWIETVEITKTINKPINNKNINNIFNTGSILSSLGSNVNYGVLKKSGDIRIYDARVFNTGNQHMEFSKTPSAIFRNAGYIADAYSIVSSLTEVAAAKNDEESDQANVKLASSSLIIVGSRIYPPIAVPITALQIMTSTDTYKNAVKKEQHRQFLRTHFVTPDRGVLKQWDGNNRNSQGRIIN